MKHIDTITWVLIIFAILTIVAIANCEPIISMYQAPSDKNKTVVECWYEDGKKTELLVVRNTELDTEKVDRWVVNICIGRSK